MADTMTRTRAIEILNLQADEIQKTVDYPTPSQFVQPLYRGMRDLIAALRLAVAALEREPAFIALARECADDTDDRVSGGIQSMAADALALVPADGKAEKRGK